MTGNWMLLVGMLLSFGALVSIVFMVVQIFILKKVWLRSEQLTDLFVRMMKLCEAAEENKMATQRAYREALAEKKYAVGEDGSSIIVMPKTEEAG